MQPTSRNVRGSHARRELLLLVLVSVAFVAMLAVGLHDQMAAWADGLHLRHGLVAVVVIGAGLLAVAVVWHVTVRAHRAVHRAHQEAAALRRNFLAADAIIRAEPHVLILWEQGHGFKVAAHNLASVPGLPEAHTELVRFSTWLEAKSAVELEAGLSQLLDDGRPFNLLLKTEAGGHLEADGRTVGELAVLRFRDVAGYKRDLVRVLSRHDQLTRDIHSRSALLDALPMPVWLRTADGRLEWVNTAYVRAVEAADGAEVCQRQIELLESRQRASLDQPLRGSEPLTRRLPLIVGGERRAHDVIVVPLDGAAAAAAIDVTALESAQGELDRQIAAYDRTLDRVATAVAIFGPDQRLVYCNDAYRHLWQLDTAWLETRPSDSEILDRLRALSKLPDVVDYRTWKANLLACYRTSTEIDDWWHLSDGRVVHVFAEQRPDGGVAYLYDDATERIASESRHNALIEVQRETLDNLKEGVAVFAPDGRLKLFNSSFAAIWKLSRRALLEGPHIEGIIREARHLCDDHHTWTRIAQTVTAISDEREPVAEQMVRSDGSVIAFASAPLSDGATLLIFSDVTDARSYERALVERKDALAAADRLKNRFIGHVSSELRTPLTNILGFSELLASPRTGPLAPKQREFLGDIAISARTLLSIIDDILDLAKIDAGALKLALEPVNARSVLNAAVFGVSERARRARLTIEIAAVDDSVEFAADERRVRQVLDNLLANAVNFSKPGGVIHVSCRREASMVAFTIEDHGTGIPKDQQRGVFERFESRSRTAKPRGAGLGLAIVKSMVELHTGDMSLNSEPGRGTRITVRFPIGIVDRSTSERQSGAGLMPVSSAQ